MKKVHVSYSEEYAATQVHVYEAEITLTPEEAEMSEEDLLEHLRYLMEFEVYRKGKKYSPRDARVRITDDRTNVHCDEDDCTHSEVTINRIEEEEDDQ